MEPSLFKFDFHATVNAVGHALVAVVCHILFDFAMVGIGVAAVVAVIGLVMGQRKHRFEKRFYTVAKRVALACLGISLPGLICLAITHHFPESGNYVNFSLGFLVLWSMVTIYLCAEEMNHEWFDRGQTPKEIEVEPEESVESSSGSKSETAASAKSGTTASSGSDSAQEVIASNKEQVESGEHHTESVRETIVKR
jgi:hypothetical protein